MKKQTAVQWLLDTMANSGGMEQPDIDIVFNQALEMEKQQIVEAFAHGNLPTLLGGVLTAKQYYKETYED
jgi:hypothetical protein